MAKTVRLSAEITKQVEEQRQRFIEKFGREPNADDPIFFDGDAKTPTKVDISKVNNQINSAMLEAKVRPEFIYAYRKTGLVVNEEGYRNLTRTQRAEYLAALQEYRDQQSRP